MHTVDGEFGSDNRAIHDDGKAQELTEVDVRAMKGRGTSGQVHYHLTPQPFEQLRTSGATLRAS